MVRQELLEATDAAIDDAVNHVEPIVLRGLLYLLTGDEEVAAIPETIVTIGVLSSVAAVKDPDHVALLRGKAAAFLKAYRDNGAGSMPIVNDRLRRSLELAAGEEIPDDELDMWLEQAAFDPMARSYDGPPLNSEDLDENFRVAIIGAGMAGLNAAVQLKQAGIPFVCIEKNDEVGGTWRENRYPGARLDTSSRSYFHTLGVDFHSPGPFSVQAHNESYTQWLAKEFDLHRHVMFNTEVSSVAWDDDDKLWTIQATNPDGKQTIQVQAVISAVGFLSRPNIPDFKGADQFRGLKIHTATWPADLDITGKRIAVIGSGATSYQMVPELAKKASHLAMFQREPSWCFEAPGYLSTYPPQVNWLDRNFPYLTNFLRFRSSWNFRPDVTLRRITIDPDYQDTHAVSAFNKAIRESCIAFMRRKLGDREELVERMIPRSPPFSSRPVLVDSHDNIYDALLRDDVELVSDGIDCIVPEGIRTSDGTVHEADIIVFATGFRANDFLWPMDIRGRNGASCEALWAEDGARAYLGAMIPDFPNFFIIYGPNMNSFGVGLGIIELEELVTRFSVNCIGGLLAKGLCSIDVAADAFDRYNRMLDREEARRIWSDRRSTSYYKNEHGRSACNCPFDIRQLWNWLRDPVEGNRSGKAKADPVVRAWFGADLIAS